jgi:hypothetical protein
MMHTVKDLAKLREERKQEKIPPKESPVVITKIQQSLLNKSIMLGKEIEEEIQREQQRKQEEAKEQFRIELGHIIAVQAQNNVMPGIVPPPLPKQIDALLNKQRPVDESEPELPAVPMKESPVTGQSISGQTSGLVVVLAASPAYVDSGNSIAVSWEVTAGTTSTSDWIGLFAVDQPNKQYVTYEWNKQGKKGTLHFTAPSVYGTYEFRYFPASSYEHAARSTRVIVGKLCVATLSHKI